MNRINEIEARLQAATDGDNWPTNHPGKWYIERQDIGYKIYADEGDGRIEICDVNDEDDAKFIANARQDVPWLLDEIKALQSQVEKYQQKDKQGQWFDAIECAKIAIQLQELAEYRKAKGNTCEYSIYVPAEEGYPDTNGRFYRCSCGADCIDIESAQEWQYCPHCGKPISSFETYGCVTCKHADWDGDGYYCKSRKGKYSMQNIDDANFDGCKIYKLQEEVVNEQN